MKYPEHARRMKEALSDKGINAADLSRLSKINQSSLSQYLNGTNKPNSLRAVAIASILEVNPVWLMGFDVPKYVVDEKSQQQTYYLDDETAEVVEAMATNPKLKALLYAQRNMSDDEINASTAFHNAMIDVKQKEERLNEDDPC